MPWIILIVAGLLEVVWSLGLKKTEGFTRLVPSVLVVGAMVGSMVMLAHVVRTLPLGTAYAVWVGIGVAGAAVGGHYIFGEALPPAKLAFLSLLLISIIGLKLTSADA